MSSDADRQSVVDAEHLKLLTWFWYIKAGLSALFVFVPMIYGGVGAVLLLVGEASGKPPGASTALPGALLLVFAGVLFFVAAAVSIAAYLTGRFIAGRRHRIFCIVAAVVFCLSFPYGTILGILTLLVLFRESVAPLFEGPDPEESAGD